MKEVQRCYRCGSFDVDEIKFNGFRVPIYHKAKNLPVHVLENGESINCEINGIEYCEFPRQLCDKCVVSFNNWLSML